MKIKKETLARIFPIISFIIVSIVFLFIFLNRDDETANTYIPPSLEKPSEPTLPLQTGGTSTIIEFFGLKFSYMTWIGLFFFLGYFAGKRRWLL